MELYKVSGCIQSSAVHNSRTIFNLPVALTELGAGDCPDIWEKAANLRRYLFVLTKQKFQQESKASGYIANQNFKVLIKGLYSPTALTFSDSWDFQGKSHAISLRCINIIVDVICQYILARIRKSVGQGLLPFPEPGDNSITLFASWYPPKEYILTNAFLERSWSGFHLQFSPTFSKKTNVPWKIKSILSEE